MGQSFSGDSDYDDDELPLPRTRAAREKAQFLVKCPEGSCEMYAKIPRELHGGWKLQRACVSSHMATCVNCEADIETDACRYCCREHRVALCIDCARDQLGLPEIETASGNLASIEPGDVLFTLGDETMMIHHVLMITSDLQVEPLNPRDRGQFALEPGNQLLGLDFMESASHTVGLTTQWVSGTMYFVRTVATGETKACGIYYPETSEGEEWSPFGGPEDYMKFKVLMNPVRKGAGGPGLDRVLFKKSLHESALNSKPWTPHSGLASGVLSSAALFAEDQYETTEMKEELLQEIRTSRETPGVCSSVPVIIWQDYFMTKYENSADDAAQMILQYMPIHAENAVPSQLVQYLTQRGWALQENFEPGKLKD